jgi:hypothetical protein
MKILFLSKGDGTSSVSVNFFRSSFFGLPQPTIDQQRHALAFS